MGVVDKLNELDVEEGTSKRFDCIFCGKKNTLSVTKAKGKLLWNCFSASCNSKGNVGTDYSKEDLIKQIKNDNEDTAFKHFIFPDHCVNVDRSDIESGATGGQPKKSQTKISTLIQKRKDKTAELAKTGKGPDAYKVAGEKRQQDRLDPNRSDAKAKRKESEKPPLTKKQKMAQKKIDSLPTHTATQREYKQKTQIGFDKHLKKTNENFDLDEAMSSSQISQLKKAFEPMRGKRISMSSGDKLRKILDKVSDDKNTLVQLYKADIPFVSRGAATRLISKHNVKGAELNAMSEEIMLDEKISGLVKKSDKSGISYGTLKKVYDRGMAAWKTGHRPGTTPQQWAFARVNSFITKGKGTWGGADKDLAKQVKEEAEMHESLWANIHAKRARGEKMRKKGAKGAPTAAQFARAKRTARKK